METVTVWKDFARRLESKLADCRQNLELMQSGTVRHREQHLGGPMLDVSQREIDWSKRTIATYEKIIAQIRSEHGE